MSHRNPKGNLAFLNASALELLIGELEKEKLGATDQPRGAQGASSGRHVPAHLGAVSDRDAPGRLGEASG